MRKIAVTFPLLCLALSACVSLPSARTLPCEAAKQPAVRLLPDGRTHKITIDVLTYNVEGLPNRLRTGRPASLREIGKRLALLRRQGAAPDIVMFQEVFSRSARAAVLASGYPSLAPGPSVRDPQPRPRRPGLPGFPDPRRGELGLKLASSGIVIASEFPIVERASQPFAKGSCAGLDCLSNKGLAFARIYVPGMPLPLDLFTTHMNSMGASRVSPRRHLAAHRKQSRQAMSFLAVHSDPRTPTVFAGDFNMRGSDARFAEFSRWKPLTLVHRHCLEHPQTCQVRMSWDGDAPWMDTQDLQLFRSGEIVKIRPIRVETMFDGGESGARLSDHDGFRVLYEVSWPADLTPLVPCPADGA